MTKLTHLVTNWHPCCEEKKDIIFLFGTVIMGEIDLIWGCLISLLLRFSLNIVWNWFVDWAIRYDQLHFKYTIMNKSILFTNETCDGKMLIDISYQQHHKRKNSTKTQFFQARSHNKLQVSIWNKLKKSIIHICELETN